MTLYFFVLLTLLKFAVCLPGPNVNVDIDVRVGDKGCLGGGCDETNNEKITEDTAGCKSGTTIDSCLMIECIDGELVYQGKIFKGCGTCYGYGDPHFVAFDNHIPSRAYTFMGVGSYAMTQFGRSTTPKYGVTSTFQTCAVGSTLSCIKSVTYQEPGLVVELEVPVITNSCYSTNPNCKVKVTVNNVVQTIQKTVEKRSTGAGKVYYIFDDSHGIPDVGTHTNVNCINIVGSTGISVSLCTVAKDYALLYVWLLPVPSVMNHVYGMCGRYTGTTLNDWMERSGILIAGNTDPAMKTFANTWRVYNDADNKVVGIRSISENKCTNEKVKFEIENECKEITAVACESIPAWECSAFIEACVFDLCQFSNHTSYAQGYAEHMLIHIQLANSNDTCYSS